MSDELAKSSPTMIRKVLSFLIAFFYAGLLINAIRGMGVAIFLVVIGTYPSLLNFLADQVEVVKAVKAVFLILGSVLIFMSSRNVYRRFANTLSEEDKQKRSAWKSGVTALFIIIGSVLYYIVLPVLVGGIEA